MTRLQGEMEQAAEELRFEKAAALRDQIRAIEQIVERQKVVSTDYIDSDVIAMARANGEACVQVFFIRSGKLIGREYFIMEGTEDTPDAECWPSSSSNSTMRPPPSPRSCCCRTRSKRAQSSASG